MLKFQRNRTKPQVIRIVLVTLCSYWSKLGFVRVLENLESPGILFWHFPGLENPGKKNMKFMEGSKGN